MFGREVTPNHHKLAEEFVLLDNLYCNGHVSADGHPWSTMAYNTDYIARNWALTYSVAGGVDDDDEGDLSKAPSGYLWDACARDGSDVSQLWRVRRPRSQPDGTFRIEGACRAWSATCAPITESPRPKGRRNRDTDNVETFLKEFHEYEKNGNLPRFMVMSLGEDHTTGTRPGTFTPKPAWPATTWPWAGSSRPSRTASPGPRRPSSSSRTTLRTAPTTSTPIAPSGW